MHVDKTLIGVLHASVAENENSLHASTLRDMPALVRVASNDQAVPPWFGRRMARVLREHGAAIEFDEQPQSHWWWDTARPNDGGAMHDEVVRDWTLRTASRSLGETPSWSNSSGSLVITSSSPEYQGRHGVIIRARHTSAARASIRLASHTSEDEGHQLELQTTNTVRFALGGAFATAVREHGGSVLVDGHRVALDSPKCAADGEDSPEGAQSQGGELCRADPTEPWVLCDGAPTRPPLLLGPIRRVFARRWLVVLPDDASEAEVRLAAYFGTGHFTAVGTASQAELYSRAIARGMRSSHRFVYIGVHAHQRFPPDVVEVWPVGSNSATSLQAALEVGRCRWRGPGLAAAFISPVGKAEMSHLDLVVTATDEAALRSLVVQTFATNQAHTRAPFSNMLPDFLITGPDFEWKGHGGILGAGFFDGLWGVGEGSYLPC